MEQKKSGIFKPQNFSEILRCPKCHGKMKEVKVKIQDADSSVTSYQCSKCGYFDFEEKSMNKAIDDIKAKESILAIKQKIIKLSKDRLGMYLNRDVVRSLNLKAGEEVYVSVPDDKHLLIRLVN